MNKDTLDEEWGEEEYIKFNVGGEVVSVPTAIALNSQYIKLVVDNFSGQGSGWCTE